MQHAFATMGTVASISLDRDVPAQPRIVRAVDLAHAAHPELRVDDVRTYGGTGNQGHGGGSIIRVRGVRYPRFT